MAEDQHNTESSFFFSSSFPDLPELSCLSSSPSSSLSSSFPSETWWDELKSNIEEEENHNCMDFMDNITWDDHDNHVYDYTITDHHDFHPKDQQHDEIVVDDDHQHQQQQQQSTMKIKRKGSKDLVEMFSEWLKTNKGLFSPEDLKKVKLKRSTIESSIQRFGGGEEGMKRLLKLILEWVQKHHLHNQGKRIKMPKEPSNFTAQNRSTTQPNGADYVVSPRTDHNPSFHISNWSIPHLTLPQPPQGSPYAGVSTTMADSTMFSSMVGTTSKSVIDFNDPLSPSQFSMPSPSKEARRTRMARQKRVSLNHNENYQHAMLMLSGSTRENCISIPATANEESEDDPAIQVYWP